MQPGSNHGSFDPTADFQGARKETRDAYARIRSMVACNVFPPGMQIQAKALAEKLGISSTPAREALIRLSVEGWIVSVPNKGFFTRPLRTEDLMARYEFAFMLLKYSIENSAKAFSSDRLQHPPELEYGADGKVGPVAEEVRIAQATFLEQLYERIASLSGNEIAVSAIRKFILETRYIRLLDLEDEAVLRELAAGTAELARLLTLGRKEDAIAIIRDQMEKIRNRMGDLVKEAVARSLSSL
ncbi:GntR family transcriptional regulator [Arenibaculum sp.]|uniref:GntR family transcriptional regulator n=1 Tax=Arenibaculum sp. TaxID=2865862 RepID=UPI002E11611E|nr:GntR family transcriptional regulator [Arenibaculum sp.]